MTGRLATSLETTGTMVITPKMVVTPQVPLIDPIDARILAAVDEHFCVHGTTHVDSACVEFLLPEGRLAVLVLPCVFPPSCKKLDVDYMTTVAALSFALGKRLRTEASLVFAGCPFLPHLGVTILRPGSGSHWRLTPDRQLVKCWCIWKNIFSNCEGGGNA